MIEYIIVISGIICLVRAAIGPTIYDRVVALDSFLVLLIALMAVWSQSDPIYIDIAIVFSALGFGATLVFSKYMKGEDIWS